VRRTRPDVAVALAAVAFAAAGCGGGSKAHSTTSSATSGPLTGSVTLTSTSAQHSPSATQTSQQPGAQAPGGSEPARAPATLTGSGGKITPTTVQVPPYIAVEISLSSADGRAYTLTIAGRKLSVSGSQRTASVTLPGLRPGTTYKATGAGQTVTITPSAEPGP
jgi:hypothetical protein